MNLKKIQMDYIYLFHLKSLFKKEIENLIKKEKK
jgi:hypothetical protein